MEQQGFQSTGWPIKGEINRSRENSSVDHIIKRIHIRHIKNTSVLWLL